MLALHGLHERQVGGERLAWIARLAGLADRLKSRTGLDSKQDWLDKLEAMQGWLDSKAGKTG